MADDALDGADDARDLRAGKRLRWSTPAEPRAVASVSADLDTSAELALRRAERLDPTRLEVASGPTDAGVALPVTDLGALLGSWDFRNPTELLLTGFSA